MRTRTGQAPHVLATPNNLALGLLGRLEITEIDRHSILSPIALTAYLPIYARLAACIALIDFATGMKRKQ